MKMMKRSILTMIFFLTCVFTVSSANIMKIRNATGQPSSVITIEVEILNDNTFAGFNLDIPLPAGFTYVSGSATLFRGSGHSMYFNIVPGNIARAISFAIPTTNFLGNSGVVLSFDVQTPAIAGSHVLNIVDAVIANSSGADILTGTLPGTITIQQTGSNVMKIHDVTAPAGSIITIQTEIINQDQFAGFNLDIPLPAGFSYVAGSATLFRGNGHSLYFNIVPVNTARALSFAIPTTNFLGNSGLVLTFQVQTPLTPGNHTLNLIDAVIANTSGDNILTSTIPGVIALQGVGTNVMKIHDVTAPAGSIITIQTEIINQGQFAGFNLDIPLPAGFSYVAGSAALFRGNGHSLYFNIVPVNTARALSFAIPTTNFLGNSGIVLTFQVQTPPTPGTHTLNLADAVIANSAGDNILTQIIPGTVLLQPAGGFPLSLNLILEGAYSPSLPALMHTILRDGGLIPLQQPFAPPLPYFGNPSPVWYYSGNEGVFGFAADIVDWVLVELRDAPSAAMANSSTVVARRAALLKSNGQVVGTNGLSPVFNVTIQQNLYVVVYHRNHLPMMSAQALSLVGGNYSWNFTLPGTAYLQGHKHLGNNKYGMYGGDGDGNAQIQTQDKNEVWNIQSGSYGYKAGDFDLNGQVQTQDKNEIWNPNSGIASQVP